MRYSQLESGYHWTTTIDVFSMFVWSQIPKRRVAVVLHRVKPDQRVPQMWYICWICGNNYFMHIISQNYHMLRGYLDWKQWYLIRVALFYSSRCCQIMVRNSKFVHVLMMKNFRRNISKFFRFFSGWRFSVSIDFHGNSRLWRQPWLVCKLVKRNSRDVFASDNSMCASLTDCRKLLASLGCSTTH